MKLSDKALRLIGRNLLDSMDDPIPQDEPQQPRNNAHGGPATGARTQRSLNLRRRTGSRRAAVLLFRSRSADS